MILAVDASAIVAIALGEPEAPQMRAALANATRIWITPVNLLEAGLALVLREGLFTRDDYLAWLSTLDVEETDVVQGPLALDAYVRYGRGVHPAGLNLGDCFAYALAKSLDAPLLYKGEDFRFTDVRSALQPT